MMTVLPRFCARRMVKEYAETMYTPATQRSEARGVTGDTHAGPRPAQASCTFRMDSCLGRL